MPSARSSAPPAFATFGVETALDFFPEDDFLDFDFMLALPAENPDHSQVLAS
jgi:hypothetical protein